MIKLVADSGATKAEWCLLSLRGKKTYFTQGISPYFLNREQIAELLRRELYPKLKKHRISEIHYYGTGCSSPANAQSVKKAIGSVFSQSKIMVTHDLMGAARALCGKHAGIACILGTGSSTCFFNGKRIARTSPGLGYILGDEGSGASLGRKVIQHYLYDKFDKDLMARFDATYTTNKTEILENVYSKPMPNRYLASYTLFLAENRGNPLIEKIIVEGLDDYFQTHLTRFPESSRYPVHFVGGVAFGFRDVIENLCRKYEFIPGTIMKNPMEGLVIYHQE